MSAAGLAGMNARLTSRWRRCWTGRPGSRRRLRWRRLAVAAAAVVIVGGAAVAGARMLYAPATRRPRQRPWAATVSGSDPRTGMSATVKYRRRPWGLALQVQVSGISPGTRCELQVVDARGQDVPAGGWMVAAGHAWAWYPASSPLAGRRCPRISHHHRAR